MNRTVRCLNVPRKVGSAAWERCWELAAEADIFGLQESFTKGQRDLYRRLAKEAGYGHRGLVHSPNPVFWDRDVYAYVRHSIRMVHPDATGPLAKKYPGYNDARYITDLVLRDKGNGREVAVLNLHFAAQAGRKVDQAWLRKVRRQSIQLLRWLVRYHQAHGRVVIVMGDTNMHRFIRMPEGFKWLSWRFIDKLGVAGATGTARLFAAPTDHKHGGIHADIHYARKP